MCAKLVTDLGDIVSVAPGKAANTPKTSQDQFRVLMNRTESGADFVVIHSADGGKTAAAVREEVDFEWLEAMLGADSTDTLVGAIKKAARVPINRSRRLVGELAFIHEAALLAAPHTLNVEPVFQSESERRLIAAGLSPAQAKVAAAIQGSARRYG